MLTQKLVFDQKVPNHVITILQAAPAAGIFFKAILHRVLASATQTHEATFLNMLANTGPIIFVA